MKFKCVVLGVALVQLSSLFSGAQAAHDPLPVKSKFLINEVSPLEKLWNGLTESEKKLTYHLQRAGRAGRDLLFHQNHRNALAIKEAFERAVNDVNFEKTRVEVFGGKAGEVVEAQGAWREFLTYLGMFEDQGGPYSNANRKVILRQVTADQIKQIFEFYSPDVAVPVREEIAKFLTDPTYEVIRKPDPSGRDLIFSGGNMYEKGISGEEVDAAIAAGLRIDLNCQVVRDLKTGAITCLKMTTASEGVVGQALRNVVRELELALPYALTEHQAKEIEWFIRYFISGDQEDFRQASAEWVRDRTDSKIDFEMGFVEVYEDYKGSIGSWQTMIQFVDPVTTTQSKKLATFAGYFESKMPYGKFKKEFPTDYSPPAMMVYYFQEIADMHSGGYNLPNFDDMRNDPTIGAKNVIRLPLPGEIEKPQTKAKYLEYLSALGRADRAQELADQYPLQRRVIVLLHEIIGHGSGTYDVSKFAEKEDPTSALGSSGSALEEQRADLAALVFAGDSKLVEIGIYKDEAEALKTRNAMYDIYLADFLMRIVKLRTLDESHLRGHWLLINRLLARSESSEPAIEWINGLAPTEPYTVENQVLVVRNHERFWEVCRDLLGELQDIKANRKQAELEALMEKEAPLAAIKEPWAQALLRRGEDLKINYASFEQGWTISEDLKFQIVSDTTLESISRGWSKIGY